MTKFVKLTERYNTLNKVLILNCNQISAIKLGDKGKDTMVQIISADNKYYFVMETPEQIWEMLNTDLSRPPIIMTADEALKYYKKRDGT